MRKDEEVNRALAAYEQVQGLVSNTESHTPHTIAAHQLPVIHKSVSVVGEFWASCAKEFLERDDVQGDSSD